MVESEPTNWLNDSRPFKAPNTFGAEIVTVGDWTWSVYDTFVSNVRVSSAVSIVTSSPVIGSSPAVEESKLELSNAAAAPD